MNIFEGFVLFVAFVSIGIFGAVYGTRLGDPKNEEGKTPPD